DASGMERMSGSQAAQFGPSLPSPWFSLAFANQDGSPFRRDSVLADVPVPAGTMSICFAHRRAFSGTRVAVLSAARRLQCGSHLDESDQRALPPAQTASRPAEIRQHCCPIL